MGTNFVSSYEAHDLAYFKKYANNLQRIVTNTIDNNKDTVSEGWRVQIGLSSHGDEYFKAYFHSEQEIENVLEAKMNNLRLCPHLITSRVDSMVILHDLLLKTKHCSDPYAVTIAQLAAEDPAGNPRFLLDKETQNWLHHTAKVTFWDGAIIIPFQRHTFNSAGAAVIEDHDLKVGFSGSKEYIDLELATTISVDVQKYLDTADDALHIYTLPTASENIVAQHYLHHYGALANDQHFTR